ncbi:MAG TPA: hypothetical protein VF520_16990 [Thermoleophilaceae bacterium]|jgi:hypothetical protein
MLFDLRGRRRRAVQVTYLGLALLMGVGLVGAGIGSDVSGGVFDIFTGNSGGGDVNKPIEKKIEAAEKRVAANPNDRAALATIVRNRYSLAANDTDRRTGEFGKDGKKELAKAADAWTKYLATKPERPDDGLASLMLQAYGPAGLNRPEEAVRVAELVAERRDDAQSYIQLVQYATLAKQSRKADLAADRALELAPKGERKTVKQLIEQAKTAGTGAGAQGTTDDTAPSGG